MSLSLLFQDYFRPKNQNKDEVHKNNNNIYNNTQTRKTQQNRDEQMNNYIDNIDRHIENIEQEIDRNYKFISPVNLERMKIQISQLKIQKCNAIINELYREQRDQLTALEIQKQQLKIQYHNICIKQSQIKMMS